MCKKENKQKKQNRETMSGPMTDTKITAEGFYMFSPDGFKRN